MTSHVPRWRVLLFCMCLTLSAFALVAAGTSTAAEPATSLPYRPEWAAAAKAFGEAFHSGKGETVAAQFTPEGELIDEEGVAYQGRKDIATVLDQFFKKFPGAKLAVEIESLRQVGKETLMEDGVKIVTVKQNGVESKARFRYTAVRVQTDGQWLIASLREFNDEAPTPQERLEPLAWLVGEWIQESAEGVVKASYRWSEEQNFLLGDFVVHQRGQAVRRSELRIGYDPVAGKVRSWLFDADGGFSTGTWTQVNTGWIVRSSTTHPTGETASATINYLQQDKNRFTIRIRDRLIGETAAPDTEVVLTRRPPAAGAMKETNGASAVKPEKGE